MAVDAVDVLYLAVCWATSIMTLADFVPYWFAQRWSEDNRYWQGLVYRIECVKGHCSLRAQFLTSDAVPLDGRDWRVCLSLIPVLGLLGYTFLFCGALVLQVLLCRRCCCLEKNKARKYMVLVTSLFIAAGIMCSLTIILATYASIEFYSDNPIDSTQQFPWSLCLLAVATTLVIISSVASARITYNWHTYRKHFGRVRSRKTDRKLKTKIFYLIDPVKDMQMDQIRDWCDNISCADSDVSITKSTSDIPDSASAYFNMRRFTGALPRYACEVQRSETPYIVPHCQ